MPNFFFIKSDVPTINNFPLAIIPYLNYIYYYLNVTIMKTLHKIKFIIPILLLSSSASSK